jgi:short-subunit dehydrogenase
MWMSADEVVDASLLALGSGKLVVVPGWRYRLLVALMRSFPRSVYHSLSIKYARTTGRDR